MFDLLFNKFAENLHISIEKGVYMNLLLLERSSGALMNKFIDCVLFNKIKDDNYQEIRMLFTKLSNSRCI